MHKIVIQRSPSAAGFQLGNYDPEMEALAQLEVEIKEIVSEDEDEFIAEARDADAVYVQRVNLTRRAIESLESCKVISTASVGVDKIDVAAATERGIPVTNVRELAMTKAGVEPVGLTELLQRSDIVSMHAPANRETHHMMGEEQFRLMSPHSIFVNTSRGDTVDEKALIRALDEKWISAAGLDVLEQEPPDPGNPILEMENVILSPHVGSASARMDPERRRRVGREIALVLRGRWPRACVNPSVLPDSDLVRWKPYSME